jgi:hypothetical protein
LTTTGAGSAYLSTKVYLLSQMQSAQGRCESCHDPGEPGGEALLNDPTKELLAWQTSLAVGTEVEVQDTGSGYVMIAADNKFLEKSTELNNGDGTHPSFTWPQNVNGTDMGTALSDFVTQVNAILTAGGCPPGAFGSGG